MFDPRRTFTKVYSTNLHARARLDGCVNLWKNTPEGWQVVGVYLSYTKADQEARTHLKEAA